MTAEFLMGQVLEYIYKKVTQTTVHSELMAKGTIL